MLRLLGSFLQPLPVVLTIALAASAIAQNHADIPSNKDNTLFEDSTGMLSNGAGPNLFVGKNNLGEIRRGVIAFDVAASVPPGASIDSVTLTLNMSQTTSGPQDVVLRRLVADWGEGSSNSAGGMGAPATTDDATWIHRFFDTDFWAVSGGDFSPTISASQNISGIGFYTWGPTPEMLSDVQEWLDNPSTNFGWILLGNETANQTTKRFDTKENTIVGNRPVLHVSWIVTSVDHDPQPVPITIQLFQNYPNPFNPSTAISYQLSAISFVDLKVLDVLGKKVITLVNEEQTAGTYQKIFNAEGLSSGVYFYRLTAGEYVATKKLVLLK